MHCQQNVKFKFFVSFSMNKAHCNVKYMYDCGLNCVLSLVVQCLDCSKIHVYMLADICNAFSLNCDLMG